MKFNGGFLFLSVIVLSVSMLGGMLIAMPFDTEAKDDPDAHYEYTVDSIDIVKKKIPNTNKYKEVTVATITVYNHGYNDGKVGTYEFTYKVFKSRAGEVGTYYRYGTDTPNQYICDNGESITIGVSFDTVEKGGVIDTHSMRYRYVEV